MNKRLLSVVCIAMAAIVTFCFVACDNTPVNTEPSIYTIQYADDSGVHQIKVIENRGYALESIPEKLGYEFLGLYDAEVGGTQYVSSKGTSVSNFTDGTNLTLYPHFKAKEYTLALDYQGAAVTGSRSLKVAYGSEISELPMNLTIENKNFVGWFTQPDKQGIQVADQYGAIPSKNIVDESIFDLSDPKGYIYLYAGFKGEEFIVTFYATESGSPEEVKVEYGTPISEVQLETRVDGKAVIAWSKKRNDINKEEIFNGKITSEMVLYAAEYAPVIDFDSNGGESVNSVIARAGDAINLPTPIRENYKFVGWQTTSGSTFNATAMPSESVKLTAKWQAMIIFDTNGGTEVTNISEPQGTRIVLPKTSKETYVFAGWYTADNELYDSTTMPSSSLKLKARWYKAKKEQIVLLASNVKYGVDSANPSMADDYRLIWYGSSYADVGSIRCRKIELSQFTNGSTMNIRLNFSVKTKSFSTTVLGMAYFNLYSAKISSDGYLLDSEVFQIKSYKSDNYSVHTWSVDVTASNDLWLSFYQAKDYYYITDLYYTVEYPDMSTLY